MRDDPHEIADALVQEHGLDGALDRAVAETTTANQQRPVCGMKFISLGHVATFAWSGLGAVGVLLLPSHAARKGEDSCRHLSAF